MMDKWTKRFLDLAEYISQWSTCRRRKVGAIIVRDKHILSTGYNGAPAGCQECTSGRECKRAELHVPAGTRAELCIAVHAEQNAIIQAAKHGVNIDGSSMYMTTQPCVICAKMIINAGIKEVHYREDHPDKIGLELLEEAGVKIYQYK